MDIVAQISNAVAGHEDEISSGIDSVGDAVDRSTGGQYGAHVDQARDF